MTGSLPNLPRFSPNELAKLKRWCQACLDQWNAALKTYEEAGVKPDNPMFANVIEHYKGSCAGIRYLLWLVNSQKPQSTKQRRKPTDGSN